MIKVARVLVTNSQYARQPKPVGESFNPGQVPTVAHGLALADTIARSPAIGSVVALADRGLDWLSDQSEKADEEKIIQAAAKERIAKEKNEAMDKTLAYVPPKETLIKEIPDPYQMDQDERQSLQAEREYLDKRAQGPAPKREKAKGFKSKHFGRPTSEIEMGQEIDARLFGPNSSKFVEKAKVFLDKEPTDDKQELAQRVLYERMRESGLPVPDKLKERVVLDDEGKPVKKEGVSKPLSDATSDYPKVSPEEIPPLDRTKFTADASGMPKTRDPGQILALASVADTPEKRDHVMKLAQKAKIYGASIMDYATGGYRDDYLKKVVKAFPDMTKLGNLQERIRHNRFSENLAGDKFDYQQFADRRGWKDKDEDQALAGDKFAFDKKKHDDMMRHRAKQLALGWGQLRNARDATQADRILGKQMQIAQNIKDDSARIIDRWEKSQSSTDADSRETRGLRAAYQTARDAHDKAKKELMAKMASEENWEMVHPKEADSLLGALGRASKEMDRALMEWQKANASSKPQFEGPPPVEVNKAYEDYRNAEELEKRLFRSLGGRGE